MAKLLHIFYHKEGTFSLLCQQVQLITVSREILKRQNYAKNGLPKFATRHSAQTGKFRKPNA